MISFQGFQSFDGVGTVVTNRFDVLMHILRFVLAARSPNAELQMEVWYDPAASEDAETFEITNMEIPR